MRKFKTNDVVKLISGGPNMTVVRYVVRNPGAIINTIKKRSGFKPIAHEEDIETIECVWFDGNTRKSGEFDEGALILVP